MFDDVCMYGCVFAYRGVRGFGKLMVESVQRNALCELLHNMKCIPPCQAIDIWSVGCIYERLSAMSGLGAILLVVNGS